MVNIEYVFSLVMKFLYFSNILLHFLVYTRYNGGIYFLKIGKNDIDSLWERGLYSEE